MYQYGETTPNNSSTYFCVKIENQPYFSGIGDGKRNEGSIYHPTTTTTTTNMDTNKVIPHPLQHHLFTSLECSVHSSNRLPPPPPHPHRDVLTPRCPPPLHSNSSMRGNPSRCVRVGQLLCNSQRESHHGP